MAEVSVGDSIRITKFQYAAPVGSTVPVTGVDPDGKYVEYEWTTERGLHNRDWFADTGTYELVGLEDTTPLVKDCYIIDDDPEVVVQVGCESPWPSETASSPEDDPVNHPSHYTFGKYEVLDVIEDWGLSYHLGNATKYIARAGRKDPAKEKQDLEKAIFYIQRRVHQLGD